MCQRPTSEVESDREVGRREGCGDAACRIPFSPSREAIEFASCRALVCEPRDRMSRAGIAFPAIPAVRTRHRPSDMTRRWGGTNMRVLVHIRIALRGQLYPIVSMLLFYNCKRGQETNREGGGGDRLFRLPMARTLCLQLINPINWNDIINAENAFFLPHYNPQTTYKN